MNDIDDMNEPRRFFSALFGVLAVWAVIVGAALWRVVTL